jgi:hypothetical protein
VATVGGNEQRMLHYRYVRDSLEEGDAEKIADA